MIVTNTCTRLLPQITVHSIMSSQQLSLLLNNDITTIIIIIIKKKKKVIIIIIIIINLIYAQHILLITSRTGVHLQQYQCFLVHREQPIRLYIHFKTETNDTQSPRDPRISPSPPNQGTIPPSACRMVSSSEISPRYRICGIHFRRNPTRFSHWLRLHSPHLLISNQQPTKCQGPP